MCLRWTAAGCFIGMRRIAATLVPILGMALLVSSAYASRPRAKARSACPPADSLGVVISDQQAQLYKVLLRTPFEGGGFETSTVIRGCAYGQRRSYPFGAIGVECIPGGESGCGGTEHVSLVGTMLGYAQLSTSSNGQGQGTGEWFVVVRDLRSGRVLHKLPTGARESPEPHYIGTGPAVAVVLKRDGAVAWITENYERTAGGQTFFEVHAADRSGTRLLASGSNIDPSSLALGAGTLYWLQGGQPLTDVLN
jgi:hypothetical protein